LLINLAYATTITPSLAAAASLDIKTTISKKATLPPPSAKTAALKANNCYHALKLAPSALHPLKIIILLGVICQPMSMPLVAVVRPSGAAKSVGRCSAL